MDIQNIVTVLCLCAFTLTKQVMAETSSEKVHKKLCMREANVNPSLIEKAYSGDFANNKELQCFFRCYYLESGFINEAGEIQIDAIKSKIPRKANEKSAQEAIDKCKNTKGMESCETAFKMQKCLYDNNLIL